MEDKAEGCTAVDEVANVHAAVLQVNEEGQER
jgi:hypothetical protein